MIDRKPRRQIEAGRQIDLRLGHARQRDFDRIFQRDDAAASLAASGNLTQASIERCRLPAAGRANDQNCPRRLSQQSTQRRLDVGAQS